jgi:hypothetical protein
MLINLELIRRLMLLLTNFKVLLHELVLILKTQSR